MLVGMCQNPSKNNPASRNERIRTNARNRRNVVLGQMEKAGFLTAAQQDSIAEMPIKLNFHRVDHKE